VAGLISGETLRVLLVCASASERDAIGQALADRAGDHRLYWVAQAELAAVRAQDVLPHVILVDDSLELPGPAALIGQLAQRIPSTAILAMVAHDDMALARQAVLAGARGFVPKPIDADELLASLRQVLGQRQAAPTAPSPTAASGRIVVFCAPRGGTGRTTLAINTAVALQALGRGNVALVDADFASPAIDVGMNLPSDRSIAELMPRMAALDEELIRSVLASHATGVKILLAPQPTGLASPITLPQVQQVLSWLKRMFAWVLVDLGEPLGEGGFAFLDGADRIVLSVLPEMVGLRNTRPMLEQMQARGYAEEKIWLVLNRAGLHGGVPIKELEQRLRIPIKHRIPDDQPLATFSINRGVPLVVSHRSSALARSYLSLAEILAQEAPLVEHQGDDGRLGFRKLLASRRPQSAGTSS
jgi:pilus assembly protein CpaE